MKKTTTLLSALLMTGITFAQDFLAQARPAGSREWGYVNEKGEMAIEPQYRKCTPFSEEGLALFYERKKGFNIIDMEGNTIQPVITEFKIKEIFGFGMKGYSNGLLAIEAEGKWGFLDTDGKIAIPLKYDHVSIFSDGYATARLNDEFFILDKMGKETKVSIPLLKDVKDVTEGMIPYVSDDGEHGFINVSGEVVVEAKFNSVGYFSDGMAWVKSHEGKLGFIDKTGKMVIPLKFEVAKDFDAKSGLARIKFEDQWAYVNKSGEIIKVTDTEVWKDFSEGFAIARKDGLYGFINAKGEWVIKPQFQGVRDFQNGIAAARKDDLWGYIDASGKWIIQPRFEAVKDFELVK